MEQEQGGQGQEQPPTAVPPVADRPESISRSEWEDFRREVREALAAGRTPPPSRSRKSLLSRPSRSPRPRR